MKARCDICGEHERSWRPLAISTRRNVHNVRDHRYPAIDVCDQCWDKYSGLTPPIPTTVCRGRRSAIEGYNVIYDRLAAMLPSRKGMTEVNEP